MRSLIFIFTLSTTVLLSGLAFGQDKSPKSDEKATGSLDVTIELMSTIMIQLYEKADLSDDQRAKIKQIIDGNIPELVRTRDKLQTMFSAEQQKTFNAALKLANNAKYTPDRAEAFALKKLKLSENEAAKYVATKKKADDLQIKMDNEVAAVLTDEQKAKLPMFQAAAAGPTLMKFKFPNMKTQKDAQSIWQELMKVKGATEFQPDVTNQTVEFRVPAGAAIKEKLAELVKAGNTLVADWELIPADKAAEPKGADAKGSGSPDQGRGGK